jgi:hypothetical protein
MDQCRKRLYGKLGDESAMLVNLLERRQSIDMVRNRSLQILRFVRALRKGRFGEAGKVLGIQTPKGVSRKKQFSNNFLEYHFGWAPLVSDIGNAINTLQNPIPVRRIRASGYGTLTTKSGGYPNQPPYGQQAHLYIYDISVRSGVRFVMSNPDLYLANQLGFTNPLTVAWEVVPFSFVVDWFIPIGDFLGAMTATLGLTLQGGYTSTRCWQLHNTRQTFSNGKPLDYSGWGVSCERQLGAITAYPSMRPQLSFSPLRALTAVSLLIQQLRK